jgi:hypothetical protein
MALAIFARAIPFEILKILIGSSTCNTDVRDGSKRDDIGVGSDDA